MEIQSIIQGLTRDRDALSIAIMALERFANGGHRKRGRPRKELTAMTAEIEKELRSLSPSAARSTKKSASNGDAGRLRRQA